MKKIKQRLAAIAAAGCYYLLTAQQAMADTTSGTGGITPVDPNSMSQKLITLCQSLLQPMGAVVIFGSVAWCGFKLVITAHRPEDRAKAVGSFPYVIGGGVIIGGAMVIAGFVIGTGQKLQ